MKKPFYKIPYLIIERSRWNPLRYIFGPNYISNNTKKWAKQFKFDVNDITIVPKP